MSTVRLMLGDCLERMGEIEAGSIDLILTDLPYGTTACKWDVVIPFEPLWDHYRRVLKPRGAVVLTASQPFTSMLVMSNREWFKYSRVWKKNRVVANNAKVRPIPNHEDIVIFSLAVCGNGARNPMTYNPLGLVRCDRIVIYHKGGPGHNHRPNRKPSVVQHMQEFTNYPMSIIDIGCDSWGSGQLHPTQKPVALMEYLIRTYSNEDETVLDSCMGSGTTGVACINTNRNFIGIELDPGYFVIAERRIAEARSALPLLAGQS